MPNYVAGVGPFNPKLMIIGEAPGRQEDACGIPFVGPSGAILDNILEANGIHRSEVYITNVVKFQPPLNDFKKLDIIGVDLAQSIRDLWDKEINVFKPNCILAVGDEALNAVTGLRGILNYRGSILRGNNGIQKVVPTIHPAALFSRASSYDEDTETSGGLAWTYLKLIKHDIARAIQESNTRDINLPERSITVAHSSLDVYRFFQEYKSCTKAVNDIESVNCIPVCTGFAFNKHHAISIPLLSKIGHHPLTDMSRREVAECWKMVQETFDRVELIGQNYKYDEYKQALLGFRNFKLVSDTLFKSRLIFAELPKKGMGALTSLWTREPFYKDEGKEQKIGKSFNVDRFFKYNGRDCAVNFEIDEEMEKDLIEMGELLKIPLKDFYYNYEMRKHSFYLRMENRGFRVDFAKKKQLLVDYTEMEKVVHARLAEQIGYEVNVKSPPQMYKLLYGAMGFKARKKEPTSEDTIIALMGNSCKGKDAELKEKILKDILEERRIRDQKSRQINFEPDYDGRCKTSFKVTGTETGRTSTNILKKPVRPKKIGLAFHTISKHGRLAKDIRSMFIPDEGKIFIQADASQAEARIVAKLAKDDSLLTAFDTIDIHRRTAGLFFGLIDKLELRPIELSIIDNLEKDGPERFTGKMFRHAGNYDMGKRRAMNEFNVNAQKYEVNMSISEWKAGKFIELFHGASPNIRGVFHSDIKRAIDGGRLLINPFGRPRIFNGREDNELYKEAYAYIPQSTVADLVQGAGLLAEDEFGGDENVYFCSENHDALVMQAPINNWEPYAKVLKKHMQRTIDFSQYCTLKRDGLLVIPSDIEISLSKEGNVTNYGQLNKVKVVL